MSESSVSVQRVSRFEGLSRCIRSESLRRVNSQNAIDEEQNFGDGAARQDKETGKPTECLQSTISVILLAGGKGVRMGSPIPKQFLQLGGKPIVCHSLEVFLEMDDVTEVIVVCDPTYRHLFSDYSVKFGDPGPRRQDSVFNGFGQLHPSSQWVCIHDGARPMINREIVERLFQEGQSHGAACVGMPMIPTVKSRTDDNFVDQTIDRDLLWEIQTPQFLSKKLLADGFALAREKGLTLTDDVSLAELQNHPVKLVKGGRTNIKITTPEDLIQAKQFF